MEGGTCVYHITFVLSGFQEQTDAAAAEQRSTDISEAFYSSFRDSGFVWFFLCCQRQVTHTPHSPTNQPTRIYNLCTGAMLTHITAQ